MITGLAEELLFSRTAKVATFIVSPFPAPRVKRCSSIHARLLKVSPPFFFSLLLCRRKVQCFLIVLSLFSCFLERETSASLFFSQAGAAGEKGLSFPFLLSVKQNGDVALSRRFYMLFLLARTTERPPFRRYEQRSATFFFSPPLRMRLAVVRGVSTLSPSHRVDSSSYDLLPFDKGGLKTLPLFFLLPVLCRS